MGGYFGPPSFTDYFVPGRARLKQFGFGAEAFCFFGKSLFKGLGLYETATLHDTTSCLRVLTVGFTVPIVICRRLAVSSEVNNSIRSAELGPHPILAFHPSNQVFAFNPKRRRRIERREACPTGSQSAAARSTGCCAGLACFALSQSHTG